MVENRRSWRKRVNVVMFSLVAAVMASTIFAVPGQAYAQPHSGDALVIDADAGTGNRGALFSVNPTTGNRTLISDFGDSSKGPLGFEPAGLVIESPNKVLVIDAHAGTGKGILFRVDLTTGERKVVSNFGVGTPLGLDPVHVNLEASGSILVTDDSVGGAGKLFRVNATTGNRTILSDFGDSAKGPTGADPFGLDIESSGQILVADGAAGTGGKGKLFRVDPLSGIRTNITDFGVGANQGIDPVDVVVESSTKALVIDAGGAGGGFLFRVDIATGSRTIVSDFSDPTKGPLGTAPFGLTIEPSGQVLVTDVDDGTGARGMLFRVDPITGIRTEISDFGKSTQGELGMLPHKVVSIESPNPNPGVVSISASPSELLTPGKNVMITLCAGDSPIHVIDAIIFEPIGSAKIDSLEERDISANQCLVWNTKTDFVNIDTFTKGPYVVRVDTDTTRLETEFAVSFLVIPESAIGSIALVSASLGALGLYMYKRRQ